MKKTSKSPTHTPGPWEIRDERPEELSQSILIVGPPDARSKHRHGRPLVVAMRGWNDTAPSDTAEGVLADARLIAAAPDLLIAAKVALNHMYKDWPGIADLLIVAIAKAETTG